MHLKSLTAEHIDHYDYNHITMDLIFHRLIFVMFSAIV